MGNSSNLPKNTKFVGKRPPPPGINNTKLVIDRKIELPNEYKNTSKDICQCIRNVYAYDENASIQPAVNSHCNLGLIELSIFENWNKQGRTDFPVRLYISSILPKNIFAGFYAKKKMEVGTNHLAVQICDKIIHWYDNSLVNVCNYSGKKALAIFYPFKANKEMEKYYTNTPETRKKICEVIQRWNCTLTYSSTDRNCQHFASEMFGVLGFDNNFKEGPFGEFIKFISNATNKQTNPCIVEKGKIIEEWKNHYELDDWTKENMEIITADINYYLLIKGFHRAYQARKLAFEKEKEEIKEEGEENVEGELNKKGEEIGHPHCPMGEPVIFFFDSSFFFKFFKDWFG
eukprot:TRINITY_DN5004_c1_g1_i2.p1 TRINITY_DN5004_c1_g1~~TRINITY_DN5004_c1_g1_i2.p1  ORF type:complete len:345 (+),score=77.82 TRINITY_DN5004_c1_g1_i2:18-1052(+)